MGMKFERCLYCLQAGHDPTDSLAAVRRIVPAPKRVHVLLHLFGRAPLWSSPPVDPRLTAPMWPDETLIRAISDWATTFDGELAAEFDLEAVRAAVFRTAADLVVVGPFGETLPRRIGWLEDVARRTERPVLFARVGRPPDGGRGRRFLCPADPSGRGAAAVAAYLRDETTTDDEVTFLTLGEPPPTDLAVAMADLAGVTARIAVESVGVDLGALYRAVMARLAERPADLVILPAETATGLPGLALGLFGGDLLDRLGSPVLLFPRSRESVASSLFRGRLEASDAFDPGRGPLALAVEALDALGRPNGFGPGELDVVTRGRSLGRARFDGGMGRIDVGEGDPRPAVLGLGRPAVAAPAGADPLEAVECRAAVVTPGQRRVWLADAELAPPVLAELGRLVPDRILAAVRLREEPGFADLREVLSAAGIAETPLLDAGALLDDGRPDDLPGGIEDVRLRRVASRLRAWGIAVEGVVSSGTRAYPGGAFLFATAAEALAAGAAGLLERAEGLFRAPREALDELSGSELRRGNRVEVEIDNGRARRRLIELVDQARERLHVEVFIVREDEVVAELEEAIARAAERGVRVRFLADSLWSAHLAFGRRNPVLERLALRGVSVRAYRPIAGLPTLESLKSRDHRKLVVVDGAVAVVSGRNFAASYLRGFEEVVLRADSPQALVPWLDAGIEVEGPLVEDVEAAFLALWTEAGGERFPVFPRPPAGTVAARLVTHEGLRDARTTEAYLELVRRAERDLVLVNTFPIQKEIGRALEGALRRGVRLRILLGNVRPSHGDDPTPFAGGALRDLATQVVHGRVDDLVEAGAEVYEFGLGPLPGWESSLGRVRPHVHAKIVVVDGRLAVVGSANLDITAGYWDSEAMVLVEDEGVAGALGSRLDTLLATSYRMDRADPHWRSLAARRAWLARHWPSIIG